MPDQTSHATGSPLNVVIAGGGVAALESALALRDLAGDKAAMTIVSPGSEFTYWPTGVLSPFERKPPRRLALSKFAAHVGAELAHGAIESVDADRRLVAVGGRDLPYDALLIATGGRISHLLTDTVRVNPATMQESLGSLIQELDAGSVTTLALVAPRPTWPWPAYELALLVAERARERRLELQITIITAEPQPLAIFGEEVSAAAAELLANGGIRVLTSSEAESSGGGLRVHPGARDLQFDRVVALPTIMGPAFPGLPADANGFVPITARCEAIGAERVYAAGDATGFPVKFGSIAAEQGDVAATAIALLADAQIEAIEFTGIIHGLLLTGGAGRPLYFTARIVG